MDNRLIGRERECEALGRLLQRDDVSLVSLTGPGGIGKTRLALEVARRSRTQFEHGIAVVLLAALREPEFMMTGVAKALGLEGHGSVPPLQRVAGFLQDKQVLLVLDNFEQLMQAAPLVGELLAQAPGVKVLVTSRMRLHVSREHEYGLGALELPDPRTTRMDQAQRSPAVALFVQRAQAVQPGFALREDNAEAVAAICLRLDGWPLAIELAAARLKLLGPEQMRQRLGKRLPLLTGGPVDGPLRQRTMRGTLDWSHELLGESERKLFAQLSVFQGGATLEAIESVCGDVPALLEALQALVDHSLVVQSDGRFMMLETLREYAGERLQVRGEADEVQLRHANYYQGLAERAEGELRGPLQRTWFATLESELDNARAALSWSLGGANAQLALRHAGALGMFWVFGGHALEGRRWLEMALAGTPDAQDAHRAKAMHWYAAALSRVGDMVAAREKGEDALARFRELGDRTGTARALLNLGWARLWGHHDIDAARRALEESLATCQEIGDVGAEGAVSAALGTWYSANGLLAEAQRHLERGLALSTRAGDALRTAIALGNLGDLCNTQNRLEEARRYSERALPVLRDIGDRVSHAICLCNLADIARKQGDLVQACTWFRQGLAQASALGDMRAVVVALEDLAHLCLDISRGSAAVVLVAAAQRLREQHEIVPNPVQSEANRACGARAREVLGAAAFERADAEGRSFGLSQAMALVNSIEVEAPMPAATAPAHRAVGEFTPRERDVLVLLARGLTDRQIGERLKISGATASKHVANLLAKAQQRNRLALAIWARDEGLVEPD